MSKDIIEYINNTQRPLIGLEYIAILVDNDDTHFKEFRCLACRMNAKALLARHIIKHVESVQHQLKYLVSVFVRPSVRRINCPNFWLSCQNVIRFGLFSFFNNIQILHFPSVSGELYRSRTPTKQRTVFVYAICDAIERTYGRKQPQCVPAKAYHNAHCARLTHFDENMGADFMDVLRKCRYNSNFSITLTITKSPL